MNTMRNIPKPAVVWMPNVEIFMLLVNLTEEGARYQTKAVHPLRRAAWLRFDPSRRAPAVVETGRLLREGFWLDAIMELALAAEVLPKASLAYPLSRDSVQRLVRESGNGEQGLSRLNRYLEMAAAFTLDAEPNEFLRAHAEEYRGAVGDLENALGEMEWLGTVESYFGTEHRSYLCAASLLMPAGFAFGLSLGTPEGPVAFHVTGPFIETDASLTFASPEQAAVGAEREFIRAFLKPVISRGQLSARSFVDAFERSRASFQSLGYRQPLDCLEDHLVQVIQARLTARRGGKAAADAMLKYDAEAGYVFSRQLAERLEDYELHRTDFPAFEKYFPHLMDSFR